MAGELCAVSHKKGVVITPHDPRIAALVPHLGTAKLNGREFHVLPFRPAEARLLNNMGYDVPPPVLTQYDWGGVATPFDTQKQTAAMLTQNPRAYVLSELGSGKSLSALFAYDYLHKVKQVKRALVVAPLSTLSAVWENEVFRYFPHLSTAVLHGPKAKRVQALKSDADVLVINHDGVRVILDELVADPSIDCVIIDELAVFRNARTVRWKQMVKLLAGRKFAWGMTGSPTPKAPTDAYAQIRLLTPDRYHGSFRQFQGNTMAQVSQFKWREKPNSKELVYELMQPSVRFTRAQCAELPPTTYTTFDVELSKEQAKAYKELTTDTHTLLTGLKNQGQSVTPANAGVLIMKLLQVGAGFLYGEEDENGDRAVGEYDAKNRLQCLKDIIDSTDQKIIVYAPFVHALSILERELSKDYDVAVVHGGVSSAKRNEIFALFQKAVSPKVLIAHPRAIAHGLTLTAANTIVWYSPTFDLEIYEQANGRITRHGQKHNTLIAHIQATPTEKRVYSVLKSRGNMLKELLALFEAGEA